MRISLLFVFTIFFLFSCTPTGKNEANKPIKVPSEVIKKSIPEAIKTVINEQRKERPYDYLSTNGDIKTDSKGNFYWEDRRARPGTLCKFDGQKTIDVIDAIEFRKEKETEKEELEFSSFASFAIDSDDNIWIIYNKSKGLVKYAVILRKDGSYEVEDLFTLFLRKSRTNVNFQVKFMNKSIRMCFQAPDMILYQQNSTDKTLNSKNRKRNLSFDVCREIFTYKENLQRGFGDIKTFKLENEIEYFVSGFGKTPEGETYATTIKYLYGNDEEICYVFKNEEWKKSDKFYPLKKYQEADKVPEELVSIFGQDNVDSGYKIQANSAIFTFNGAEFFYKKNQHFYKIVNIPQYYFFRDNLFSGASLDFYGNLWIFFKEFSKTNWFIIKKDDISRVTQEVKLEDLKSQFISKHSKTELVAKTVYPVKKRILSRTGGNTNSGKVDELKLIVLPFKKVRTLSNSVVAVVKDFEEKIWVVEKNAVYLYDKEKLTEAKLEGRYKGQALNAFGTTKGFYVFYGEDDKGSSSGGRSRKIANSVKYYNGSKYLEVFTGQADPINSFVDSKGRLWIAQKENKITIVNGTGIFEFTFKSKAIRREKGLSENSMHKYYEDTKGRIWVWSDYYRQSVGEDENIIDGLLCYSNGEIYSIPVESKTNDAFAGLIELPSGEFLVSFQESGTWLFDFKKLSDNSLVLYPKGTSVSAIKDFVILSSLRTKDGNIVAVADNKHPSRNDYYSVFLISNGKTENLNKDMEFFRSWGRSVNLCEDSKGSVWITGGDKTFKVLKNGSLKEYDWSDGLKKGTGKCAFSYKDYVHILSLPEYQRYNTLDWDVYDNSIDNTGYNTGWEHISSLCVPVVDSANDVWFVDEKDGWLKTYSLYESDKAANLNVFAETDKISSISSSGKPAFLGMCKGSEKDIWLFFASDDIWVAKYNDGEVKEYKLKDIYKKMVDDKNLKTFDQNEFPFVKAVFSADGYIVMADCHSSKKLYLFNKVSWEVLESVDINGEVGLEVSIPSTDEENSIFISLRDKNQKERTYVLRKGKWQVFEKNIKAVYYLDSYRVWKRKEVVKDGISVEFDGGSIKIKNKKYPEMEAAIPGDLQIADIKAAGDSLWFTIGWRSRMLYDFNYYSVYPVYRYNHKNVKSANNTSVSLTGASESLKLDSSDSAYKYLLSENIAYNKEAERYFRATGEKGREYLKGKLLQNSDERIKWKIEAILSK